MLRLRLLLVDLLPVPVIAVRFTTFTIIFLTVVIRNFPFFISGLPLFKFMMLKKDYEEKIKNSFLSR